ncbi:MAG: glucose 1-dehydrogenase [Oscillatoriales cyanobacterium RM1_1_9]|nr:glucose 1-dehydrogenase [Oscillatoriales cyanobacterium SM2_3_0]NJO45575.1 glucose 1-dehydrogenase [Oscillatoriales cyanobacterium RM2_1_1]NJO71298.1 glucose 1-dehydrogenase [Oscillatoriales cyanobacterium RM1_1_9]
MRGISEKNVLVTGATSGIGQAIAVRFAQEGANVALNYRGEISSLDETQNLIQTSISQNQAVQVIPIKGDVRYEDQVTEMFRQAVEKLGSLDILINNAGIQIEEASHEVETDDFDLVISVNLRGAYLCAREAIQCFLTQEKAGIIINISSVHEVIPRPQYLSYSISKGGLQNMTKTLALEYSRKGIRVNSIAPGATKTSINDWQNNPEEMEEIANFVPMGRVGTPEEMAAITVFLASEDTSYITGQTLFIDGGLTLYPSFAQSGVT